jgi:hypothetical protein
MVAPLKSIEISGLEKGELAALRRVARKLGLSPETYARQLVKDGLALEQRARTTSFDKLYADVQARFDAARVNEKQLDHLVDQARSRHHRLMTRRTR